MLSTQYIETSVTSVGDDKGGLKGTGQMGSVMSESTEIAHAVSKSMLRRYRPDSKFFANNYCHMHIPEGATPKDGPSAGITMITSMVSHCVGVCHVYVLTCEDSEDKLCFGVQSGGAM